MWHGAAGVGAAASTACVGRRPHDQPLCPQPSTPPPSFVFNHGQLMRCLLSLLAQHEALLGLSLSANHPISLRSRLPTPNCPAFAAHRTPFACPPPSESPSITRRKRRLGGGPPAGCGTTCGGEQGVPSAFTRNIVQRSFGLESIAAGCGITCGSEQGAWCLLNTISSEGVYALKCLNAGCVTTCGGEQGLPRFAKWFAA